MTLRTTHLNPISAFQRKIFRRFINLSDKSPVPSLHFLTGELPIEAKIHRDVFSTFYIICCNPQSKIYEIVKYLLENSPKNSHTWARHIYNLAEQYEIEDPLETKKKVLPSKMEYSRNILIKITAYHEKILRMKSLKNSKMTFLNISVKGLNGRCHPALQGVKTTKNVQSMRPHIKMLSGDYYTYQLRSEYKGGSPHCRLCLYLMLLGTDGRGFDSRFHFGVKKRR